MVWADAADRLTGPPLQAPQVRGQAVLAAWDAEWRATGPQWTRQR
jgi:hypothetical protein